LPSLLHAEEVLEDTAINVALKARHPFHVELLRLDPAPAVELAMLRVKIDVLVLAEETAKIIDLLLPP